MDVIKDQEKVQFLDCRKKENIKELVKCLYQIKPIKKAMEQKYGENIVKPVPLPVIEEIMTEFQKRYGMKFNNLFPYYEEGSLAFYKADILNEDRKYFGSCLGYTITETFYKIVLKMYYLIKTGKYKGGTEE